MLQLLPSIVDLRLLDALAGRGRRSNSMSLSGLAGEQLVGRPQGRLRHAAGGAEDAPAPVDMPERSVELLRLEVREVDARRS